MKKIFVWIFMLIIVWQAIIPVSASTTIVSEIKAPDYDVWMAESLIQGVNGNGGLYKTFIGFQDPIYRMLGSELLEDKPLVSLSTAWSIFFNSEYRNQFANEQKYIYEIILMDYLKYGASIEVSEDEELENEIKFLKELYSSLAEGISNLNFDNIDKSISVDEAIKIWENAKIADGINTAIEELDDGLKTVKELIDELSLYLAVKETKENTITLLEESKSVAGNNVAYKNAVNDILNALKSTKIEYIAERSAKYLWNQFLDESWDKLTDINPILKAVELGIAGLDVYFDTTTSASNNLKLALLYTIDCYMRTGMSNATQTFLADRSAENGRKFKECFEAYVQFQMFGNEFAKEWLGQYLNGGAIKDCFNLLFQRENIKTAKELESLCQNQTKTRKSLLISCNKLTCCANSIKFY